MQVTSRDKLASFYLAVCLLSMMFGDLTAAPFFLPTSHVSGLQWAKVGYLNMSDPTQQCPSSWQTFTSPRSCGKKDSSSDPCASVSINTSGASYQKICGRFSGYQVGSPDAFLNYVGLENSLDNYYVDGVSITYGSVGNRQHVYTYATGNTEFINDAACPCAMGTQPPSFVGSDYYCESGNDASAQMIYNDDLLWDGQLCRNDEVTCCDSSNLPWFCKSFPTPISKELEVRICLDEAVENENVAIESFELYILIDINECDSSGGLGPCQQICTNTNGSFICSCQSGYVLSGYNCTDVNECDSNGGLGPCQQICTNTNGSFICSCKNIDECIMNEGERPCPDVCINTPGSYNCSCFPCQNGLCINASCWCVETYTGENCSQPGFSGCELDPCLNGGVCIEAGLNRTCICPINTTGKYCENTMQSCRMSDAAAAVLSNMIVRRRHLGTSQNVPAINCAEIKLIRSEVTTGVYWIMDGSGAPTLAFCKYL